MARVRTETEVVSAPYRGEIKVRFSRYENGHTILHAAYGITKDQARILRAQLDAALLESELR